MSYKQVGELRKAGRLDEAMVMAEADLAGARDKWSCGALFWVLRDKCRALLDEGKSDEAAPLTDRMEELLAGMDDADGVARKALNGVRYGTVPFLKEMLHARDLSRDEATLDEALRLVADVLKHVDGEGRPVIGHTRQSMAGWVVQEWLKQRVETAPVQRVKSALAMYLTLDRVDRPSALHSQVLYQALRFKRAHEADFKFAEFFRLWGGASLFTADDRRRGEPSEAGRKAPLSLEQRAVNAMLGELRDRDKGQPLGADVEALLVEMIGRYPDETSYKRMLGREYALTGRRDKAIAVYRRIVPQLWRQFYVWLDLAGLLDDEWLRIGALCKAITLQRAEQFLTRARLDLAHLLLNRGEHAAAARELSLYEHGRQAAGQRPGRGYYELKRRVDAAVTPATSNAALYRQAIEAVEEHFASLLESVGGVVTRRTNKRGEQYAMIGGCYLDGRMLRGIDDGTEVVVRYATDDNGKRIAIKVEKRG